MSHSYDTESSHRRSSANTQASDSQKELEALRERVRLMEQEAKLLHRGNLGCQTTADSDDCQDDTDGADNDEDEEATAVIEECSVYVGNIDYATSLEELQTHFQSCGNIKRATILSDGETGLSKGFAYIEFATPEAAQAALTLNDSSVRNRTIKVSPKRVNIPSTILFTDEDNNRQDCGGKHHRRRHHQHFAGCGGRGGMRGRGGSNNMGGRGGFFQPFGRHHHHHHHPGFFSHPFASDGHQGKHHHHEGRKGCGKRFGKTRGKHFSDPSDNNFCGRHAFDQGHPFQHHHGRHHHHPFHHGSTGMSGFHHLGGPMHHGPWGGRGGFRHGAHFF